MKKLLAIFSILLLAGCGWEPVYGDLGSKTEQNAVEATLAQIAITNIQDREGQYLRNALIDRFYRHARPANAAYTLSVGKIQERLTDLDITKSSDATRGQLRLSTTIVLIDRKTENEVLTRKLRSITSYNILGSEFTNRVSEENARQNALDDLARQIELQISLHFQR
ncbi:MAG: twin-arginine translocation pathway signal protein [Micavibrio sp.]|nr:MAG: twin-arginine translocation pathway signal protein [Micavibrio sp.]